jgi:hypothetical protein
MEEIAAALEASSLGAAMRDSTFFYPIVNILHLIGLVMVLGGIGLLDLRMLGLARQLPLAGVYGLLTGTAVAGVCVQMGSGFLLFASDATALIANDALLLKMLLFAAALLNAALFRLLWRKRIATWDAAPPFAGRMQSALSLFMWGTIGALGRLIAYV